MIDAVRARFRIGFHKRPLAQIHLFFFAQILFRAPNRFFFPEGRPGGVFGNLVLQREKRAIRFEFGQIGSDGLARNQVSWDGVGVERIQYQKVEFVIPGFFD